MMQLFRTSAFGTVSRGFGKQLENYAKADATKRATNGSSYFLNGSECTVSYIFQLKKIF